MAVKTHRKSAYKFAFSKRIGKREFHTITLTVPNKVMAQPVGLLIERAPNYGGNGDINDDKRWDSKKHL